MKAKIAVLFLVGLLCLTTGCSNTPPITKEPAPVSSSESKEVPDQTEPAQATEKAEVEKPQSAAQKEAEPTAEATVGVSERNTQTETVSIERESGTTPPTQPSDPPQKSDMPERRSETTAPPETEPPAPPATEASKPTEQPQPTEPPTQEPTEPAFDISYWISFAKSYAESVGLTLNSGAVYCWDNPIDADSGCIYLERDIQSRLNRYAADEDITDVWIWYESVSANSYRIYIGYA